MTPPFPTRRASDRAGRRHAALERGAAGTHPLVLRARVGIGGDHGAAESIGGDQKRRVRRQREAFDIAAEDSGKQNRRVDGRLDGGLFLDRQEDRLHGPKPSSSYSAIVAMIARGEKTFLLCVS